MSEKFSYFTVRLTEAEANRLAQLAEQTERSKGAVLRRLLSLTSESNDARNALGVPAKSENQK